MTTTHFLESDKNDSWSHRPHDHTSASTWLGGQRDPGNVPQAPPNSETPISLLCSAQAGESCPISNS